MDGFSLAASEGILKRTVFLSDFEADLDISDDTRDLHTLRSNPEEEL